MRLSPFLLGNLLQAREGFVEHPPRQGEDSTGFSSTGFIGSSQPGHTTIPDLAMRIIPTPQLIVRGSNYVSWWAACGWLLTLPQRRDLGVQDRLAAILYRVFGLTFDYFLIDCCSRQRTVAVLMRSPADVYPLRPQITAFDRLWNFAVEAVG